MKKLMFMFLISLMVSMFGCDDAVDKIVYIVADEIPIESCITPVTIRYLNEDGNYQEIITTLPWKYEFSIISGKKVHADIIITKGNITDESIIVEIFGSGLNEFEYCRKDECDQIQLIKSW